jgi:NAD(P)-dependent dehydrogenase (short-subunit alcohol dehydrogenase family)
VKKVITYYDGSDFSVIFVNDCQSAYPVSKAGIDHLTTAWATEFAVHKIPVRVNCISPGPFPSDITGTAEQMASWITQPLPGFFNPIPMLRPGT